MSEPVGIEGHRPRFSRYNRGSDPVTRRPQHGSRVVCSCGDFDQRVNDGQAEAARRFSAHVRDAKAAAKAVAAQGERA